MIFRKDDQVGIVLFGTKGTLALFNLCYTNTMNRVDLVFYVHCWFYCHV